MLHYAVEQLPSGVREALASLRQGGAGVLWESGIPVAVLVLLPSEPSFEGEIQVELAGREDFVQAFEKMARDKSGRREGE